MKIIQGDIRDPEVLEQIKPKSVSALVTSPPYLGPREYTWVTSKFFPYPEYQESHHSLYLAMDQAKELGKKWRYKFIPEYMEEFDKTKPDKPFKGWIGYVKIVSPYGDFGQEDNWWDYVINTKRIVRKIRPMIEDTGSIWWNIGDSFSKKMSTFKLGIPFLIRIALTYDMKLYNNEALSLPLHDEPFLWPKDDVIWAKDNPVPWSGKQRLTTGWEGLWHFTLQKEAYFDLDSIRGEHKTKEPESKPKDEQVDLWGNPITGYKGKYTDSGIDPDSVQSIRAHIETRGQYDRTGTDDVKDRPRASLDLKHKRQKGNPNLRRDETRTKSMDNEILEGGTPLPPNLHKTDPNRIWHPLGKNPGDVWKGPVASYKGAHTAVFPDYLIIRPILSTVPPGGTLLDPFMGSGTTAVVATKLNKGYWLCKRHFVFLDRHYAYSGEGFCKECTKLKIKPVPIQVTKYLDNPINIIGVELNPRYLDMIEERVNNVK